MLHLAFARRLPLSGADMGFRALCCSAVLSVSGCTVDAPEGEGLFIADAGQPFGLNQTQDPATAGEMPPSGVTPALRSCVRLDLFSARVVPRFSKDCVRCHDGTKGKATQLLDLSSLRSGGNQAACDVTLSTSAAENPGANSILTFADPGNPSTQHDFKYATPAEFALYRADVLAWLMAE